MVRDTTRQLLKELKKQGWDVSGGGSTHYRCVPPDKGKAIVYMAASCSDVRGYKNNLSQLRKSGFNK